MTTDSATKNLHYTSAAPANLDMQISVGAPGMVVPPGGGGEEPGWPILNGSITFVGPDGKISQPIHGSLPGQSLVKNSGLFGIAAQGPVLGGGLLYIYHIEGTNNYGINTSPETVIENVQCSPWPPGS